MKVSARTKKIEYINDEEVISVIKSKSNVDQREIFSWTVVEDEFSEPEYIILISKTGVMLEVEYDENVLSTLANEFRIRGVL